jgi:hypothetical protein
VAATLTATQTALTRLSWPEGPRPSKSERSVRLIFDAISGIGSPDVQPAAETRSATLQRAAPRARATDLLAGDRNEIGHSVRWSASDHGSTRSTNRGEREFGEYMPLPSRVATEAASLGPRAIPH